MTGRTPRQDERVMRPALLRAASPSPAELAQDRERALELTPVSRETLARIDRFVPLLLDWQQRVNLIAPSTQPVLWTRHIADSLQLLPHASDARVWADLGSGAGFPGLVLACALADVAGAHVDLVESNTRKVAFLREAIRVTGAPASVHAMRIAEFAKSPPSPVDMVTARAVAPLSRLLLAAYPLLTNGTRALFLKGQGIGAELTEATKCWKIQATLLPSRTEPNAQIVLIRSVEPRSDSQAARSARR